MSQWLALGLVPRRHNGVFVLAMTFELDSVRTPAGTVGCSCLWAPSLRVSVPATPLSAELEHSDKFKRAHIYLCPKEGWKTLDSFLLGY